MEPSRDSAVLGFPLAVRVKTGGLCTPCPGCLHGLVSFCFALARPSCWQFPQYVNLTMNTFVCTTCSGAV